MIGALLTPIALSASALRASLVAVPATADETADTPGAPWKEAPALAHIFTPRHVPEGTYRAYVSDVSLEDALKQVTSDPAMHAWPGAWEIERLTPADAFGQGAGYNRWTVARLYGATTARVARGPRMGSGWPVEAWTLISPYPNAALDRLERGTLLIVLKVR